MRGHKKPLTNQSTGPDSTPTVIYQDGSFECYKAEIELSAHKRR